ncbi:unnamed protein product, partial [Acanthoscelides obtectus]
YFCFLSLFQFPFTVIIELLFVFSSTRFSHHLFCYISDYCLDMIPFLINILHNWCVLQSCRYCLFKLLSN